MKRLMVKAEYLQESIIEAHEQWEIFCMSPRLKLFRCWTIKKRQSEGRWWQYFAPSAWKLCLGVQSQWAGDLCFQQLLEWCLVFEEVHAFQMESDDHSSIKARHATNGMKYWCLALWWYISTLWPLINRSFWQTVFIGQAE